jgi:hypothetical protein
MSEIAKSDTVSGKEHTETSVAVNGTPSKNQILYLPGTRTIHTVATCSFTNVHT